MHHIKSIKSEPYLFSDYLNYFWGLIVALVIIGIILYYVLRDKPTHEEVIERIPPFEMAKQRLQELDQKKLIEQNRIKLYYVELTDIVRSFIEREMKIPALESTTDELIETITDFNESSKLDIPDDTLKKLQRLLQEADLVKFAKMKPLLNEIELHRRDAETVIDIIHPAQVAKARKEEQERRRMEEAKEKERKILEEETQANENKR
jgi:Xaa-Pro aminopeptidase